jgi:hypothetical protein
VAVLKYKEMALTLKSSNPINGENTEKDRKYFAGKDFTSSNRLLFRT